VYRKPPQDRQTGRGSARIDSAAPSENREARLAGGGGQRAGGGRVGGARCWRLDHGCNHTL